MTKLANSCAKYDIINRLTTGESSNKIAKDHNVSGQRIRQIKQENRKLIEEKAQELISNLPDIVETVKIDIEIGKEISYQLSKLFEKDSLTKEESMLIQHKLSFKRQVDKLCANILRSVGIFPAHAPAFMFQKIYQDNRVQPVISERFMKFLDSMAQEDIIEDIENVDIFEE